MTSVSTPPSIASSAPPGLVSSAGWKISRTPLTSCPCSRSRDSTIPTPIKIAVCTSWPQAWQMPGWRDAKGSVVPSEMGKASMSARRPTRPSAWSNPGAVRRSKHRSRRATPWLPPAAVQQINDQPSGAMLFVADFRVGVDVAANADQFTDHAIRLPRDRGSTRRSRDGSLHRLSVTCGHRTSRRRPSR